MMINAAQIDWNNINKAIPAFLTISIMPLTYSISYGQTSSPHLKLCRMRVSLKTGAVAA